MSGSGRCRCPACSPWLHPPPTPWWRDPVWWKDWIWTGSILLLTLGPWLLGAVAIVRWLGGSR